MWTQVLAQVPTDEISKLKDVLDYRTAIAFLAMLTMAVVVVTGLLLKKNSDTEKTFKEISEEHAAEIKALNASFAEQLTKSKDAHLATAIQAIPATQRMIPLVEQLVGSVDLAKKNRELEEENVKLKEELAAKKAKGFTR